jgi:hypothetical protein
MGTVAMIVLIIIGARGEAAFACARRLPIQRADRRRVRASVLDNATSQPDRATATDGNQ